MKQHQIFLNSQTIAALDKLENVLKISKAKIIQKALNQLKRKFADVLAMKNTTSESPTKYLLQSIETAKKERKKGTISPRFNNAKDAITWLNS